MRCLAGRNRGLLRARALWSFWKGAWASRQVGRVTGRTARIFLRFSTRVGQEQQSSLGRVRASKVRRVVSWFERVESAVVVVVGERIEVGFSGVEVVQW